MSSRREKQAELRRRMAEARSKLSLLTDEPDRDDDGDGGDEVSPRLVEAAMATSAATASSCKRGEKRPLVPPPRGGILRKPKYSNTSSSITDNSATGTPAESNADAEQLHDVASATNNGLGALMADYGESSSSDDDDDHDNNIDDGGDYDTAFSSSSADNGYASRETQINPPRSKAKPTKKSTHFGGNNENTNTRHNKQVKITVDDDVSRSVNRQILEAPDCESSGKIAVVDATPSAQGESGTSSEISDEVWDEFNALLEEDGADASNNATTDGGNKSSISGGAAALADVNISPATNTIEKVKKKKKKESASTTKRDVYDNDATNNFEQASYEARLARLMLIKSKKALQRNNNGDDDDGVEDALLLTTSGTEFYDPGLAFREEEVGDDGQDTQQDDTVGHDDGDGRKSSMVENATTSKSGNEIIMGLSSGGKSATSTTSTTVSSQPTTASAPRTLARILRVRRDEARKLSSRGAGGDSGNGGSGAKQLDDEDEIDGQWF
jgi:hypothetical protein